MESNPSLRPIKTRRSSVKLHPKSPPDFSAERFMSRLDNATDNVGGRLNEKSCHTIASMLAGRTSGALQQSGSILRGLSAKSTPGL